MTDIDISALAPILRDLGAAAPAAIVEQQGGSSPSFRIDLTDGSALVLKSYDEIRGKGPAREAFATGYLKDLGLPVTHYLLFDESRRRLPFRFAITSYLRGASARDFIGDPDAPDIYRQMGALLRRLHAMPMPAFGYIGESGIIDPIATNADYVRAEAARQFGYFRDQGGRDALADQLERLVRTHFDAATQSRGPAFAHNDLHPGNVLAERDAGGKLRLTGLIDFGNARAADPVFDLAKNIFNTEHEAPGSTAALRDGYGPIDHPDPELALWFYTVLHRISMWNWLRHVGIIADGERHELIAHLEEAAQSA